MKRSEQINELAAALAKAQGEIQNAATDKENPHFRSTYATLDAVWNACRIPLSKNGLSVMQTLEQEGPDYFCRNVLLHASGQYFETEIQLILSKRDMQGLGSAFTYARRYCLQGLAGVAPTEDDDDGNAASTGTTKETKKPAAPKKEVASQPQNINAPTQPQIDRLYAIVKEANWSSVKAKAYMKAEYGIESTKELTREQYQTLCEFIEKHPEPKESQESKKESQ